LSSKGGRADDGRTWLVQGGVMGYSLVALSMMILYSLALIYREIFSQVRASSAAPASAAVELVCFLHLPAGY
jgi:hypothetical protein